MRAAAIVEERRTGQGARAGADALRRDTPPVRVKILGDGPDKQKLEALTAELGAPVDFLGYQDYPSMAAWLSKSDIVVNSLVKTAAQSIVTKIVVYLDSECPLFKTG